MSHVAQFNGSIPRIYDRDLGPLLFDWTARRLAGRVRPLREGRVLEIACGTGIATEALRRALPASVDLVATDLNVPMLEQAQARRGDLPGVTWLAADAQALPFPDDAFDAVVCQFGLMFFPDKVHALRESVRVLRPGGQILFSVWDSLDRNPAIDAVHELLAEVYPEDPPRFLETPFGLYDDLTLRALFASAGVPDVRIETCEETVVLPGARASARGLIRGTPASNELEARGGATLDDLVGRAERAIARRCGAAPMRSPLRAIFVLGLAA